MSSYFCNVSAFILAIELFLSLFWSDAQALTCYDTDDDGRITEVTNASWKYCGLVPDKIGRPGSGTVFGIGPETDGIGAYASAFSLEDSAYRILTVCFLEMYDFRKISIRVSPRDQPEFLFRCVCNYDRCNKATNFKNFLSSVKEDNSD